MDAGAALYDPRSFRRPTALVAIIKSDNLTPMVLIGRGLRNERKLLGCAKRLRAEVELERLTMAALSFVPNYTRRN